MRSEKEFLREWFRRFPKHLEIALNTKQQCEAYSFLPEIELNNLFLSILKSVTTGTINLLINQLGLTRGESATVLLNFDSETIFSLEAELFIDSLISIRRDEEEPDYLQRFRRSVADYELTEEYNEYKIDLKRCTQSQICAYLHKPPTDIETWLQKKVVYVYELGKQKIKQAEEEIDSSRGPAKLHTWKKEEIAKGLSKERLREINNGQNTGKSRYPWSWHTIQNAMINVPTIEVNRKAVNQIISDLKKGMRPKL